MSLYDGIESLRVYGVPSDNPEDYTLQGTCCDMEAGEDISFKDEVKLGAEKTIFRFTEEDDDYENLGTATKNISKGETGTILLHGFMIRKDEKADFLRMVRRGVAMAIGGAVIEALS